MTQKSRRTIRPSAIAPSTRVASCSFSNSSSIVESITGSTGVATGAGLAALAGRAAGGFFLIGSSGESLPYREAYQTGEDPLDCRIRLLRYR